MAGDAESVARGFEQAGRYPEALIAYRKCELEADDARYCSARLRVLAPQEADGFAGWGVLATTRATYRELGPAAAMQAVRTALEASPQGPAAPEMRAWIAAELASTDGPEGDEARAALLVDPAGTARAKAVAIGDVERLRRHARQAWIAAGMGALAGFYLLYGGWKARGRSASWAAAGGGLLLLGVLPAGMAYAWGASDWQWFFATGAAAVAGPQAAKGVPLWLAVPGSVALVLSVSWAAGWFDAMGVG